MRKHGIMLENSWNNDPHSLVMRTFKNIFDLYVSAASYTNLPRNPHELVIQSKEQMSKVRRILTRQEKKFVKSGSEFVCMAGGCGIGKTFVHAMGEKRGDILLINFAGRLLTEEYRSTLKEASVMVLDGVSEEIPEDFEEFCKFLQFRGNGKHILLVEVPITFGFRGRQDEASLSKHWAGIKRLKGDIKSLTIAFRTYHPSYKREIDMQRIQIPDVKTLVLNTSMTVTWHVADLTSALEDYSHRKFFCLEPSIMDTDFGFPKEEFLPTSCLIPSCHSLHDACSSKETCETFRTSFAIVKLLRERSPVEKPLYVVVDSMDRRNRLLGTLHCNYDTGVIFIDDDGTTWEKPSRESDSKVVLVTADQILGYHGDNSIVILDLPDCTWRNYVRMISSSYNNITILMERESFEMGKYSLIIRNPKIIEETGLIGLLEMLQKKTDVMPHVDREGCQRIDLPINFQVKSLPYSKAPPRCTVIFGPASSGKSMMLLESIKLHSRLDPNANRCVLIHLGSILSHKVAQVFLNSHINRCDVVQSTALSPHDILFHNRVKEIMREYPKSSIHVYVDDYSIQAKETAEEIHKWTTALNDFWKKNDRKVTVSIVFQPHSRNGRNIDTAKLKSFFRKELEAIVFTLPISKWIVPCYTSPKLLTHISRNEVNIPSGLEIRGLYSPSYSASIVFGPKPKYIKYRCGNRHFEKICKGQQYCEPSLGVLVCFLSVLRHDVRETLRETLVRVLVSDETLMANLQRWMEIWNPQDSIELRFLHPREFHGCTGDFIITVNVEDAWLMESVSTRTMNLAIIDTL
ncbi:unnamed protein product [Darwinula stevensoni]|uniref:Uncharacterized protein n=1 Tax=Darwinula stevensoni TaxID=69355 RepID=A0A7R8X7V3_9CRUS|nr:unnamed protein product [Darwinula stevensoni]CAG0889082.1 unnamed protein product [Darwinula stevensoni]